MLKKGKQNIAQCSIINTFIVAVHKTNWDLLYNLKILTYLIYWTEIFLTHFTK